MIEYITSVVGSDRVTHVLSANKKNVSIVFMPSKKSPYADRIDKGYFKYGDVTVFEDMSISTNSSHFAQILLAIELVKVIKQPNK